jgi:hypothetical protein
MNDFAPAGEGGGPGWSRGADDLGAKPRPGRKPNAASERVAGDIVFVLVLAAWLWVTWR